MAKRTIVETLDDLDGSPASETIVFAVDGTSYAIDLNDKNARALRTSFAKWVDHAAKVKGPSAPRVRNRSTDGEATKIREWAKANGQKVTERGRISADVRKAYEDSQKSA